MSQAYPIQLISIEDKEKLMDRYGRSFLYEVKSDIYGCCIKLLTNDRKVKERWEENFYAMSANIRSHGRLIVTEDKSKPTEVYYDPQSKTAFLINFEYYGWIKSIALSVAGDVLEDEHDIYSVHGACLDYDGRGLCFMGTSGSGKTTHAYGLLRVGDVRVVSDDWFFVRIFGKDALAYSSEKNFYIRADLAKTWGEFKDLVEKAELDNQGRAIVDLRWVIGKGRIIPVTTLKDIFILKRDTLDNSIHRVLGLEEALNYVESQNYFNPHLLVKNDFKRKLRNSFFYELFKRVNVHLINTVKHPEETQNLIRKLVRL
ncbi:MAG: HPr kinase/phosphorylase [Candidatus Bathyarchaeota archaeon]